ncbi:hypothetical protein [Paenibacillus camerounensis]|nr:hypothetical protein [Paenibacillus camerounensis]
MLTLNRDERMNQYFGLESVIPYERQAVDSYTEDTQVSRSTPLPWIRRL